MENISSIHKYKVITAHPYSCVSACLEAILLSEKINITQDDISEYFGLNLPDGFESNVKNVTHTDNEDLWGIVLRERGLNDFFVSKNIPFEERYQKISLYQDWMFIDQIQSSLKNGDHLLCGYSYGKLNNDISKIKIGHVSIIKSIEGDKVELLDPGPIGAGIKFVNVYNLFLAIHQKKDGIWIITKKNG